MTGLHLGFPSHSVGSVHMRDWAAVARAAEGNGFDTLWHSNERFFREMFVRMTVSATVTERITLGGAVAEGFGVHPAITAQSLATVTELAEGRTTLAIGAGGSGLPMMAVRRHGIAATVGQTYRVIDDLLAGRTVSGDFRAFALRDARLHFTPGQRVPLWIASRGPRTLETGGRIADGVMIASQANPAGINRALGWIAAGAGAAQRELAGVRTMARVDVCVHPDPALAREGCRLMVAKLLWMSYPDRGFVEAAGLSVPESLERIIATRDYNALEAVAQQVPDSMVEAFCWAGTPAEVAQRALEVVRRTGITDVGFWLLRAPGQSLQEAIDVLAVDVLPRVRAGLDVAVTA